MDVQFQAHVQRGVSMIESMVALVVLSFGMLGIGTLVLASLQDTRSSLNRTRAVALAWDMAERMRANPSMADTYVDLSPTTGTDNACFENSTTSGASINACTPGELAGHDVFQWKQSMTAPATGLPSGDGSITSIASIPPTYQIEVTWTGGIVNGVESRDAVVVQTMLLDL